MAQPGIEISRETIAEFCRKHHIRKLSLFGSVLRDDFGPDSDVDMLVEFETGHTPGLRFFSIQRELSKIIGRRIDLSTENCLSPYFRDQVLREAKECYVAA